MAASSQQPATTRVSPHSPGPQGEWVSSPQPNSGGRDSAGHGWHRPHLRRKTVVDDKWISVELRCGVRQTLSDIALSSWFRGTQDSEEDRQQARRSARRARLAGRFCHPLRRRTHPLAGVDAGRPVLRSRRGLPTLLGAACSRPNHQPGPSPRHHGQPRGHRALVRVENRWCAVRPPRR